MQDRPIAVRLSLIASIFIFAFNFLAFSPVFATTWVPQTAPGQQRWNVVAASNNGFVAGSGNDASGGFYDGTSEHYNGTIWTSADDGSTWTEQTGPGFGFWGSAAVTSDGLHLAFAGCDFNCIAYASSTLWTSTDGGATWTQRIQPPAQEWNGLAISSDGSHLLLSSVCNTDCYGAYFYTSSDGGATWTEQTDPGEQVWGPVAISADGSHMIIGSHCGSYNDCNFADLADGTLWTSADYGVTWTEQTAPGAREWEGVAMSADGSHLVAISSCEAACDSADGTIWTSDDYGITWTKRTAPGTQDWSGVASSADGSDIVVVSAGTDFGPPFNGTVWLSRDGGETWMQQITAPTDFWDNVAISPDGSTIIVAPRSELNSLSDLTYLYTASLSPTLATSNASGIDSNDATLNGSITDSGDASSTIRGFEYGTDTSYGATTTESGSFDVAPFSASLSSLSCNTTYHYASYANNGYLSYGNDQSFTTNPCPSNGAPVGLISGGGGGGGSFIPPLVPPIATPEATITISTTPQLPASSTTTKLVSLYTSLLRILEQELSLLIGMKN